MDPRLLFRGIPEIWDQCPWQGKSLFLRPWPGHHNKVAERKETLKLLPRLYLYKGIASKDEEKGILISVTKMSNGFDGVGFSGPRNFQVTGRKIRVA